jgi:hypothetical protein
MVAMGPNSDNKPINWTPALWVPLVPQSVFYGHMSNAFRTRKKYVRCIYSLVVKLRTRHLPTSLVRIMRNVTERVPSSD